MMKQYRYNRRMKETCYQAVSPRVLQRQQLICTHNNINKYQSLKHELCPELRRRKSDDAGRLGLSHFSLDSINKISKEHSLDWKTCTTNQLTFFPFKNGKMSLNAKAEQFGRECLKQSMLINTQNLIKQDSFPLICPKKFNPIKIQKLRKRCPKIDIKSQVPSNPNNFICQPWFITQQPCDPNKY